MIKQKFSPTSDFLVEGTFYFLGILAFSDCKQVLATIISFLYYNTSKPYRRSNEGATSCQLVRAVTP